MKDLFVLWHLGLGDHIICNGLIRKISKQYNTIFLPVKIHNITNISDMFKDLNNIKIIPVTNDLDMIKYSDSMKSYSCEFLKLGIFGDNFMKNCSSFEESFYLQSNMEPSIRWSDFKYINNEKKQDELLNSIKDDYVFVHDDETRKLGINYSLLKNNYTIYKPKHNLGKISNYSIFDYIKVLYFAKEIHCIDSSFACLVDQLSDLKEKPKYIHRYVRTEGGPIYNNNWNIIK